MTQKVASENMLVKRKSEETDEMGHPRERHDQRWNDFEKHATLDNLEPHVQSSRARCAREKCAHACVR